MRRRDLLIGAGSVAALGGGAAVAFDAVGTATEDAVGSIELDAIEIPGSDASVIRIPEPGRVTFVELFATWCNVCGSMMPELAAAHESVSDDVQFVSVTNEPLGNTTTREDVAEWWRRHNGAWPVVADRDLELSRRLDASGVPYAFVLDRRNRIAWQHRGRTSAETIRAEIQTAEA